MAGVKLWLNNGDLRCSGITLRRVGWQINGGQNDGQLVKEILPEHRSVPHGSFTPIYIEVDD